MAQIKARRRSQLILPGYTLAKKSWLRSVWKGLAITGFMFFLFIYGAAYGFFTPFLIPFFVAPVAILGLICIWALPDGEAAPLAATRVLLFVFFVSLIVWPDYMAIALPGLPWITLIRLSGFPLMLCVLLCTSMSKHFRDEVAQSLRSAPLVSGLFIAFTILEVLSLFLSSNKASSISKLIIYQMGWTTVFFASAYVFRRPNSVEKWAGLLWAMAVFVSAIAIWEYRLHRLPWVGHIPSFLKINDDSVERAIAGVMRAGTTRYRAQSTFSTSLGLAEYIALTYPFVLCFLTEGRQLWIRIAAGLSVVLLMWALFLSNSRLGMVGCFTTTLAYVLVWSVRSWVRNKMDIIGTAITAAYPVLFVAAVAATFFIGRLRVAIWGGGAQKSSTDSRVVQLHMGMPKIWENPLGHGAGMAATTLGYMAPDGTLTIDSYYLSIALEYGILGFVLYYSMIACTIWYAGQNVFSKKSSDRDVAFLTPIALALLNFFVIKSVFSQQDSHPVIFMMMGIVLAVRGRQAVAATSSRNAAAIVAQGQSVRVREGPVGSGGAAGPSPA